MLASFNLYWWIWWIRIETGNDVEAERINFSLDSFFIFYFIKNWCTFFQFSFIRFVRIFPFPRFLQEVSQTYRVLSRILSTSRWSTCKNFWAQGNISVFYHISYRFRLQSFVLQCCNIFFWLIVSVLKTSKKRSQK